MLEKVLGEFSWKKPAWLNCLLRPVKHYPLSILTFLAIIVIALVCFIWLYHPKQIPKAYATVIAPPIISISDLTKDNHDIPQPINVNFYSAANPDQNLNVASASVAPLNQIGHSINKGIHIEPTISGTWDWVNDHNLQFTPKENWQADTHYNITLDKTLITKQHSLQTPRIYFNTPPFSAVVSKAAFNLNLKNPNEKNIVATLEFNYPVQQDTVASHIKLTMADGQNIPIQIHFDPFSRQAYIQSAPINVGKQEKFASLAVSKGIKTIHGNKSTKIDTTTSIKIPSLYSYLSISSINTNFVIENNGNAQQLLNIKTNIGITTAELTKNLQVYLLSEADSKNLIDHQLINNPLAVTPKMLQQAQLLDLKITPTEYAYASDHSYIIDAGEKRLLYITIAAGLNAQGGFELKDQYRMLIPTANLPQTIQFVHKGSLLALTGQQKLDVMARGLPAVQLTVYKILPQNLNQLLSQTYGNLQQPQFLNPDNFNQSNISVSFSSITTFTNSDLQKPTFFPIDISQFQTPNVHLGLYLLELQGYDPITKKLMDIKSSRLILLTNMGIIVKTNADKSQDVFVQSIVTGQPIPGANVSLIGKNGLEIMRSTTDNQGHAHFFNVPNNVNKNPLAYVISKDRDTSFIPFDRADRIINLSRFDIEGTYFDPQQKNKLNAFLFTDRGLYRPSETAHFGMIIKPTDFATHPDIVSALNNVPLTFSITDPSGRVVNQQNFTLNNSGFLVSNWQSKNTSVSGTYSANLYLGNKIDDTNLIGYVTFRVEAFTPATMKMSAVFNKKNNDGWVTSDQLQALVNLNNLYGLPAAQSKVSGELTLSPGEFYFSNYPDYQFLDPLVEDKKNLQPVTEELTPTTTDARGKATFDLSLSQYNNATYNLYLYAKGYQPDGSQAAEASASIMVSPLPYVVGYKTASHLNFIRENSTESVNFIALNPTTKPINLTNLTAALYVLQPISVLVQQADGTYAYQSKIKSTLINKTPFSIAETGSSFTLPTAKSGNYRLIIMDDKQMALSQVDFTVVGKTGFTIAQQANLDIKLDKKIYTAGSEIKLALHTPYAGSGLITIEKNRMVTFKWFQSKGGDMTETIPIPADFHGTGYVEVNYARASNATEIFMNPFSYVVAPFSVDNTPQTITVNLQAPDISLPGENLPITYSTDQPSKLVIFAIDKGILDVASYETPNPLDYFFAKQALQVETAQTLDLILPRFQENILSATGGGDDQSLNKHVINPFQDNLRKPIAYWSAILDATTTPQTIYYHVPNYFNGALQIMAVAVNDHALGNAEKQSLLQAHFIMSPNAPNLVTPGDKFTTLLTVTNNLKDKNASTHLTIEFLPNSNFVLNSPATLNATLLPGQSETFNFKLEAGRSLGSSNLKFVVNNSDKRSVMTQPITIAPATLYRVNLQNGFSDKNTLTLKPDIHYYPAYRRLTLGVSHQASILIPGILNKIKHSPFYDPKQFNLTLLTKINKTPRNSVVGEQLQQQLNKYNNGLPNFQNSDGSFSGINLFKDSIHTSLFVMRFLTIAKMQGYEVPADVFTAGLNYLQTYAYQNQISDPLTQAEAILILTQNEVLTTNAIDHLQTYLKKKEEKTWQANIATLYLAASYQLLQQQAYANKLVHAYIDKNSDLTAQSILLISNFFPEIAKQVISVQSIQYLISALNKNQPDIASDIDRLLALQAYSKFTSQTLDEDSINGFIVEANINNQWKPLTSNYSIFSFPADVNALRISTTDHIGYFYQLMTAGFPNTLQEQPLTQGLEVASDIENDKNHTVDKVKLGDIVTVHLRIRSLAPNNNFNANIINLLPAGFQLINSSLNFQQYNQVNIRNDRLLFNVNVTNDVSEIAYKLRATTPGQFVFPSVVAESNQFDVVAKSISVAKSLTVE